MGNTVRVRVWYYEVSFAPKGEKARWVPDQQHRTFKTFVEAQQAAIDNNERPYRIKDSFVDRPEPVTSANVPPGV